MKQRKPPRKKKCKFCKKPFQPSRPLQETCQKIECALGLARIKEHKKAEKERKQRKKEFYENDIKTRRQAAVQQFNRYIRLRDATKPCISCQAPAGKFKLTCGHFITSGSCAALRFDPLNAHGQCWWNCNRNKSGNITGYRKGILYRYGEAKGAEILEYLEGPQPTVDITVDWYRAIETEYKGKCKELEKRR